MIQRYVTEINIETNQKDRNVGDFFDLLQRAFLSQGYRIEVIREGKDKNEYEKYLPVIAVYKGNEQPIKPPPMKTLQQQLKNLEKKLGT